MSEAALITNVKAYVPYWNTHCAENVSNLWLPTETALRGLDGNSLPLSSKNREAKSWFSMRTWEAPKTNSPKTFSTSCTSSLADCTGGVSTVKLLKSKKIHIYPTAQQKRLFLRWFGVSRKVYNATVEHLKQPETKADWKAIKKWLIPSLPDYTFDVPRAIRDGAVMDACRAVKAAKLKFKQIGEFNEVKFRARRDSLQTLFIRNDMIRKGTIYPTFVGKSFLSESLP